MSRRTKPQLIGARLPGRRSADEDGIYGLNHPGCFGQLGLCTWWPQHGERCDSRYHRPVDDARLWRINVRLGEELAGFLSVAATVDDFGSLVTVASAKH